MNDIFKKDMKNVGMESKYDIRENDILRAGEASSNIKKILRQLGIDAKIIKKVAIATYEAEINVVIHSKGGTIHILIKPEQIEIYVEDKGPGIEDISLAMQQGYSTANDEIRELGFGAGMGLPNMKRCSDEFYIDSELGEYTILKMIFYI